MGNIDNRYRQLGLVCGKPSRDGGATFSRFVFPFAYKLRDPKNGEQKGDGNQFFYRPLETGEGRGHNEENFLERKKYFTSETRNVLFKRARWFEMDPAAWKDAVFRHRGDEFRIAMLPPRLILFEWPDKQDDVKKSCSEKKDHSHEEILRTGFLILDIYFPQPEGHYPAPTLDDLIQFNELFRYFDRPYEDHYDVFRKAFKNLPVEYQPEDKKWKRIEDSGHDDFDCYFRRWAYLLSCPVEFDGRACRIVPEDLAEKGSKYLKDPDSNDNSDEIKDFFVYADNRAYVWSAAVLHRGTKDLQDLARSSQWKACNFGHWVRFLNVDSIPDGKTQYDVHHGITEYEKKWAEKHTYHRWEERGTWYGFNYHSGVMLTSPYGTNESPRVRHFSQMYFDIVLVLFYLRITLFRFSSALAEIVLKEKGWRKDFVELRRIFNKFTILYQYPLLSNQQQAIEMYDLARRHFDITDFYEEVKREIDDTHEYLEITRSTDLGKIANLIALWGLPLAFAALTASLFGMDVEHLHVWEWMRNGSGFRPNWEFWVLFCLVSVAGLLCWCWAKYKLKIPGNGENIS